jgi:hypothetical protein
VAFQALLADGARNLGVGFRLAAVTAIYGALQGLLHVALVAQPVAYMVCKSHRQEVVDLVQLHGSTTLAPSTATINGVDLQWMHKASQLTANPATTLDLAILWSLVLIKLCFYYTTSYLASNKKLVTRKLPRTHYYKFLRICSRISRMELCDPIVISTYERCMLGIMHV